MHRGSVQPMESGPSASVHAPTVLPIGGPRFHARSMLLPLKMAPAACGGGRGGGGARSRSQDQVGRGNRKGAGRPSHFAEAKWSTRQENVLHSFNLANLDHQTGSWTEARISPVCCFSLFVVWFVPISNAYPTVFSISATHGSRFLFVYPQQYYCKCLCP